MKKSLMLILLIICMPFGYSVDVEDVGESDKLREVSEGVTRYVYGDGVVASVKDSFISYYHSDMLGSNRLVIDFSGEVVKEFKSLPFGQEIKNIGVRYAFATGKELDSSGLYYFGARYYDSDLGRFTSVDVNNGKEKNLPYAYVANNPLNLVDPDGNEIYGGQMYELDYPWGDGVVPQFGFVGSNAPLYHINEHLYVGTYNFASTVSNLGVTALSLPDVALSIFLRDELDREVFWMSTLILSWQHKAFVSFMTDTSVMAPVHGIHAARVNRAMIRAGFGFVEHDAGSRGKTGFVFKMIDEAASYINMYAPVRNFMGKRFGIPGKWFQAWHSKKVGHHLPESLMKAAKAGELSTTQRQRYATEAIVDVMDAATKRGPGMSYDKASGILREGGWGGIYNKATELTSKKYVDDIINKVPELLVD